MSRIQEAFAKNKKLFIGFVTAGDPNLATTKELVLAMVKAGVGIVEFGIPFSDPVAEGPVIQRADLRALEAGRCKRDTISPHGSTNALMPLPIWQTALSALPGNP